jgi:uncharacterized protein involved in exopolysaccharide biosynthesis
MNQMHENLQFRVQVVLAVGTLGAFLATAYYAGVTRSTLREIRKQTPAVQQAATAAQSSAEAAQAALIRSRTPWLFVSGPLQLISPLTFHPRNLRDTVVKFAVKNSGVASNVR